MFWQMAGAERRSEAVVTQLGPLKIYGAALGEDAISEWCSAYRIALAMQICSGKGNTCHGNKHIPSAGFLPEELQQDLLQAGCVCTDGRILSKGTFGQ
jgi:hypothetical protein